MIFYERRIYMNLLSAMMPKEAFDNSQSLSKEEEKQLALEFQKTGDKLTYQKLMMSLRPMMENEINKAALKNKHVPRDVLGLEAYSKLPKYVKNYDPTVTGKNGQPAQLNTHLIRSISGNLQNLGGEFHEGAYVDRTEAFRLRKYQNAVKLAKMEFGPYPTDDQVKKHLEAHLLPDYENLKRTDVKSHVGDAEFGNDDGKKVLFKDQFADNSGDYDADQNFEVAFDSMKKHVKALDKNFTDRDLEMVEQSIKYKVPHTSIALSYGVASSTVSNKVDKFKDLIGKNK